MSKTCYPANINSVTSDSLHLSGLLTVSDPGKLVCVLSDRHPVRRGARVTAVSATARSRTVTRPVVAAADPLAELGMLSARISRGSIGTGRRGSRKKHVPVGFISALVVIAATLAVGFVCRRPLGNMLAFGPALVTPKTSSSSLAAAPVPQRTLAPALSGSQPQGWNPPVTLAQGRVGSSQNSSHEQPIVASESNKTTVQSRKPADFSVNNPPGALFTHIGSLR